MSAAHSPYRYADRYTDAEVRILPSGADGICVSVGTERRQHRVFLTSDDAFRLARDLLAMNDAAETRSPSHAPDAAPAEAKNASLEAAVYGIVRRAYLENRNSIKGTATQATSGIMDLLASLRATPAPGGADEQPGMPKWRTDQQAYDAGYIEAGRFPHKPWPHLTFANAYACGASDAQNQLPRNQAYDRVDYDPDTFERKTPKVTGLTAEEEATTTPAPGGAVPGAPLRADQMSFKTVAEYLAGLFGEAVAPRHHKWAAEIENLRGGAAGVAEEVRRIIDLVRLLPKETPAPGGAATAHPFMIEAGIIWELTRALREYDGLAPTPPPALNAPIPWPPEARADDPAG